ncbi:MAG: helix-turn-helix domain-containing protein [Bacteroidota bacterium]
MDNPFKILADHLTVLEAKIDELREQAQEQHEEDEPDRLLNKKEAADYYGVSVSTIDNYRRDGFLIPIRFGKAVRFRLSDLKELAERRRAS